MSAVYFVGLHYGIGHDNFTLPNEDLIMLLWCVMSLIIFLRTRTNSLYKVSIYWLSIMCCYLNFRQTQHWLCIILTIYRMNIPLSCCSLYGNMDYYNYYCLLHNTF